MKNVGKNFYLEMPKRDLIEGLSSFRIWMSFGWHDIRQRYRRSVIGPFWFTLSTAIFVGVLGFLYGKLLNQEMSDYLPFLAIGWIVWQFIASIMNEACESFISSTSLIKQTKLPLTVYVCRLVWRNFLIFLHSLPVAIIVLIFFGKYPSLNIIFLPAGLIILFLHGIWIGIILGIVCARYRDVIPIVTSLVTVTFFLTPVMWMPEILKDRGWIANFNPFYHIIELIRAPIINRPILIESWIWGLSLLVIGFGFAYYLLKHYRNRVPYWI